MSCPSAPSSTIPFPRSGYPAKPLSDGPMAASDGLEATRISVQIPDLFALAMGGKNRVNPHYVSVKSRSHLYFKQLLQLSNKAADKTLMSDFVYLTSTWIPDATGEALYVVQLWQEWAFCFNDQFAEGHLSRDALKTFEKVVNALSVIYESYPVVETRRKPLAHMLQALWLEFKNYRFKLYHKSYMIGLLHQVTRNMIKDARAWTLNGYIEYRRDMIAVEPPPLPMDRWAYGLSLPEHIIPHPAVTLCRQVAVDISFLDNDILSLQKDLDHDVKHNTIFGLRASRGCTVQQAVNVIGRVLDEWYEVWHAAVAAMPAWGTPELEAQVATLLQLYLRMAIGSLYRT
ncbi:cycloaraneosene synthase [Microdochium nivale]|nr:cycloaraneosene synthase [Microdochium nivale]